MKVFVTGGTGFIGSYVVKALIDKGHEITILARNPKKVRFFDGHKQVRFAAGGMEDRDVQAGALAGQEAVIHIALCWGDTAETMLLNETLPSVRLFEMAAEAGVKKIIYTSSIAAFGHAPHTDQGRTCPMDNYGAAKAAAEAYLMAVVTKHGVQGNVVRPGYTFGNPCVDGGFMYTDLKIKNMVKSALKNDNMSFAENDGTQFIWAGNLAEIYMALLESDPRQFNRGCYTGVSAEFHTWAQIAEMAVEITGSKSKVELTDKGLAAPQGLPIDVSGIKNAFGLSFSVEQHMRGHIKYLQGVL
ncbi:MAG: NAD(P)-dependent oxidoreductase [Clostridiales bacterium]|jgi:UDP-glucose 4-epimerase|nr:NAD(P)-dependent oxidoreductase [Clostridiales bacterium]